MNLADKAESYNKAASMIGGEAGQVLLRIPESKKANVQEIRLRCKKPIAITEGKDVLFVRSDGTILYTPASDAVVMGAQEMSDCFRRICGYSVYSKQNQINSGFITTRSGCRIGICGTANVRDGEIVSVTDITSLNIRISRQIYGAGDEIISRLFPLDGGILIAGPPSSGKTTILRDLARCISLGINTKIMRTCVIDERGELSGSGVIDTGLSDVQVGWPREKAIVQSIRSLSPQVIICDEIGTDEDVRSVILGANAGVYIIATIHSDSYESLLKKRQSRQLLRSGAFRNIVILGSDGIPGRVVQWIDSTMIL